MIKIQGIEFKTGQQLIDYCDSIIRLKIPIKDPFDLSEDVLELYNPFQGILIVTEILGAHPDLKDKQITFRKHEEGNPRDVIITVHPDMPQPKEDEDGSIILVGMASDEYEEQKQEFTTNLLEAIRYYLYTKKVPKSNPESGPGMEGA